MSRPLLLREGGEFATLQLNPSKAEPRFRPHDQNAQLARVRATRFCIWSGLVYDRRYRRRMRLTLGNSPLRWATFFCPSAAIIHTFYDGRCSGRLTFASIAPTTSEGMSCF